MTYFTLEEEEVNNIKGATIKIRYLHKVGMSVICRHIRSRIKSSIETLVNTHGNSAYGYKITVMAFSKLEDYAMRVDFEDVRLALPILSDLHDTLFCVLEHEMEDGTTEPTTTILIPLEESGNNGNDTKSEDSGNKGNDTNSEDVKRRLTIDSKQSYGNRTMKVYFPGLMASKIHDSLIKESMTRMQEQEQRNREEARKKLEEYRRFGEELMRNNLEKQEQRHNKKIFKIIGGIISVLFIGGLTVCYRSMCKKKRSSSYVYTEETALSPPPDTYEAQPDLNPTQQTSYPQQQMPYPPQRTSSPPQPNPYLMKSSYPYPQDQTNHPPPADEHCIPLTKT